LIPYGGKEGIEECIELFKMPGTKHLLDGFWNLSQNIMNLFLKRSDYSVEHAGSYWALFYCKDSFNMENIYGFSLYSNIGTIILVIYI